MGAPHLDQEDEEKPNSGSLRLRVEAFLDEPLLELDASSTLEGAGGNGDYFEIFLDLLSGPCSQLDSILSYHIQSAKETHNKRRGKTRTAQITEMRAERSATYLLCSDSVPLPDMRAPKWAEPKLLSLKLTLATWDLTK